MSLQGTGHARALLRASIISAVDTPADPLMGLTDSIERCGADGLRRPRAETSADCFQKSTESAA